MSTCLVRSATVADAESAAAVLRASILESCIADHQNDGPTLDRWLSNKTADHFTRWLNDPDTFIVVAAIGCEIAGVGAVRVSGDLDLCYVHPNRQRSGIGRSLLLALEAQARNWGLHQLRLISTSTARNFYERNGYHFAGDALLSGRGVLRDYYYTKHLH